MLRAKLAPAVRSVSILGCRGVPAAYGGFETFAEQLALYLVGRDWDTTVYCQEIGTGPIREETWQGIRRIVIPVASDNAWGTIVFDWKCVVHALRQPGVMLTLGYNTALFNLAFRLFRRPNAINVDGMEWQREKWGLLQRTWLYLNERAAVFAADYLIADHPVIAMYHRRHAAAGQVRTISYGACMKEAPWPDRATELGLQPERYVLMIARPEPENSILQIVRAYSAKTRGMPLVVLGNFQPEAIPYHRRVLDAAGPEVVFCGPIYDKAVVWALRSNARLYVHGHTVGGTNPSLVEALAAGKNVLAHLNPFNRWVAGNGAWYFRDERECLESLNAILSEPACAERKLAQVRKRHHRHFGLERMFYRYEQVLLDALRVPTDQRAAPQMQGVSA